MPQIPGQSAITCMKTNREAKAVGVLERTMRSIHDDNEESNDNKHIKELAVSWLARCVQNRDGKHDICNKGDNGYIPTRLLDVRHAIEKNIVRLVCPNKEDETVEGMEYVSLSYCRGPHAAEQNPMLLIENLETWQTEGLNRDQLPKTFQDAFKIACWLELDWIWIDCMCIIQDSRSDWKIETKMMDEIYAGAKVNISADIGEDSQSGCFVQRRKTDITPLQGTTETSDDTFAWMNSASSLRRAWIHRERQLSRRILHCTAKGLVWECCGLDGTSFASETMSTGSQFETIFNGDTKFQVLMAHASDKNLRGRQRRERLHMLWNSTCQEFANKSISNPSDLPYILWGMAYEFHTLFRGEAFACGHWQSNLAESLNWCIPGVKPECEDYLAPSWSWLSAGCPVQLCELDPKRHKRAVVDIQSISMGFESHHDNGFGKWAYGSISVNGFLRKLRFDYSDPHEDMITLSVVEKDESGNDYIHRIGRNVNPNGDVAFRLTMDQCEKLPSGGLECYALFTTLQELSNDEADSRRQLACILLEHESVKLNGPYQYHTYKRIGTMDNINDVYSFKLRYRVASLAKFPEAGVVGDDVYGQYPDNGDQTSMNQNIDDRPEDIWCLLTEYLCHVRRSVILEIMENGMLDESGYSTVEQSETDESEWEEDSLPSRPQSVAGISDNKEETEIRSVSPETLKRNTISKKDVNTSSGQEKDDDEAKKYRQELRSMVMQIHDHPSSGFLPASDDEKRDEVSNMLHQIMSFESKTIAYGRNIKEDPKAVMYQFDDVLDLWQKRHGVVPWLERLEPCVFTIV